MSIKTATNILKLLARDIGDIPKKLLSPAHIELNKNLAEKNIFSRLVSAIGHQWVEGSYDNSAENKNAGLIHRKSRALLSMISNDNPLLRRAFDYLLTPSSSKSLSKPNTNSIPPPEEESSDLSLPNKNSDESPNILVKILGKLDEIKNIISTSNIADSKDSKIAIKQIVGIVKAQKLLESSQDQKDDNTPTKILALPGPEKQGKSKVEPTQKFKRIYGMPLKQIAPNYLAQTKILSKSPQDGKAAITDAVKQDAGNTNNGFLGLLAGTGLANLGSTIVKAISGLGTKLLGALGGIAGPLVAVAGAATTGYKLGEWINEKLDLAEKGSTLEKAKEIKDGVFDSIFSIVDAATGGGLSGNEKGADEAFKNSPIGKVAYSSHEWLNDKFTKVKDTVSNTYQKGENMITNMAITVPKIITELEKQGLIKDSFDRDRILSQISQDTNQFSKMTDDGFSADDVWEKRKLQLGMKGVTKDDLVKIEKEKGKSALYEYMYGDKYRLDDELLGNTSQGDAEKFKRRGLSQLIGKDEYTRASKDLGVDLLSSPDKILEDSDLDAKLVAWKLIQKSSGKDPIISQINRETPLQKLGLEKIIDEKTGSDAIEKASLESDKDKTVVNVIAPAPPIMGNPTPQVGASTPSAPVIPHTTESSISRITDKQMGFGIN